MQTPAPTPMHEIIIQVLIFNIIKSYLKVFFLQILIDFVSYSIFIQYIGDEELQKSLSDKLEKQIVQSKASTAQSGDIFKQ